MVVLSSSFTLNYETVASLRASLNIPEPETGTILQYHGTVDKRDSFNWNTAFADYLLVGDPVQTHLGEENQQILTILTVRIFRRLRPWYLEEYHDISDALIEIYPEYEELYQIPKWIK